MEVVGGWFGPFWVLQLWWDDGVLAGYGFCLVFFYLFMVLLMEVGLFILWCVGSGSFCVTCGVVDLGWMCYLSRMFLSDWWVFYLGADTVLFFGFYVGFMKYNNECAIGRFHHSSLLLDYINVQCTISTIMNVQFYIITVPFTFIASDFITVQ